MNINELIENNDLYLVDYYLNNKCLYKSKPLKSMSSIFLKRDEKEFTSVIIRPYRLILIEGFISDKLINEIENISTIQEV